MPKVINIKLINAKKQEVDKDKLISDLFIELSTAQQQIADMSSIVAEIQLKNGGSLNG